MKRIGFACKYKSDNSNKKAAKEEEMFYNTKTTTLKHLKTLTKEDIELKMEQIIKHNLQSTLNLLKYIKTQEKELHMLRLTSDLLPFYSHDFLKFFYNDEVMKKIINDGLLKIGNYAKDNDIRLSFHPGQFCVLASDKKDVIKNSIKEFEYHTDMAKMMGFAKKFQDLKCNIHISGKGGVKEFKKTINKLSPESRNIITVENAEFTFGLDDCLKMKKICPIVLDVHHYWIKEENYISIKDKRINEILESWRGIRPTMHYSQSREEFFDTNKEKNKELNIKKILKKAKYNKKKLSAHSDIMWNNHLNKEILYFWDFFDIMVEAKYKNIAAINLLNEIKDNHQSVIK